MEIDELFEKRASPKVKENFFPYGIRNQWLLKHSIDRFVRAINEKREVETSGREGLRDLAAIDRIHTTRILHEA